MTDLDFILFPEDGSEETERLKQRLASDPDLRGVVRRWNGLLRLVGRDLSQDVADPRLLVLEGMRRSAGADSLLPEDEAALEGHASALEAALQRHPGMQDVVEDVAHDVSLFDRCWSEQLDEASRSTSAERAVRRDRSSVPRARGKATRWVWRVGAVAAMLAFAFIVVFLVGRQSGLETIATGPDEVRIIELADGSQVRLMPDSKLKYHPASEGASLNRYVKLEGDGFFDIAPQREGFTVDLPTAVVVVLGTSFGIQATEDVANVYLATGRLSVASHSARSRPVVLDPGEATAVRRDALPDAPRETDLADALSWTGLLVFNETPVSVVAEHLSRVFEIRVIADERLLAETVTGTFDRSQDARSVLDAVAAALDATVEVRDGVYTIRPR